MLAAVLAVVAAAPAGAQSAQCAAGLAQSQDACQKAVDLFDYMAPQLGTAIAGGSATLGQGGTVGGLGHFALSIRANAVQGSLPRIDEVTPSHAGARADTYQTDDQPVPMPAVDAAIGVFKGLPLGLTYVGGVDLLVSASYLPSYDGDEVQVKTPDGSLKLGYGARVGLLQESVLIPGVSATFLKRDLPTVNITAGTSDGSLDVQGLSAKTTSWRLTASKKLFLFGVAVGGGQDKYDASASVVGSVNDNILGALSTRADAKQELTRTNYFADLSLNLLLLKVVAEVGQVSGGEIATFNQFAGKEADASRLYGSVGFRFGL
jgi:hypothetical protein